MFEEIVVTSTDHDALSLAETLVAEGGELVLSCAPSSALRRLAEDEGADLIVVAPADPLGLGTALPCPVAVARRGYGEGAGPPTVVGVGYDGSPEADAALALARRLAAALAGIVHVRVVAEILAPSVADPAFRDCDAHEARARGLLARALERLDVPAHGDVVCGAPADALQALSQDVDLLLMGAPGAAREQRLIPGTPALRLLHHAGCPLVVVPSRVAVSTTTVH